MVLFTHKTYHIMKSTQIKRIPRFIIPRSIATEYSERVRRVAPPPYALAFRTASD
jgi:hypothetical protein